MASISKTEYLKRYLEDEEKKPKRKKKPKPLNSLVPRIKILNKDIDLKSMKFGEKEIDEDDEAPVVADVIDERPVEVKIKEIYESTRWKKLGESGDNVNSKSNAIHQAPKGSKIEKYKLPFKKDSHSVHNKNRHDSDSDNSPPQMYEQKVQSRRRHDSDNNSSLHQNHGMQNNKRHDSDSDHSPPRRKNNKTDGSYHKTPDKKRSSSNRINDNSKRFDSDSDLSPERPMKKDSSSLEVNLKSAKLSRDSDSDLSPERLRGESSPSVLNIKSRRTARNSDSDLSPPRENNSNKKYEGSSRKDDEKRPDKTLSGLKAGLQNATTLREETQELRLREKRQINELDSELSGRNADTVVRDRRTGKIRDLEGENRDKEEKERKNSEQLKKYSEWGKGIEQTESKKAKLGEDFYEASKPLARYCDDEDLEERLKSIIHDDDPMSEYIKKKRRKEAEYVMPEYSGPPPSPNRFAIKPGYRWDGVDRSNGFERKYFEKHSNKKAIQEEAYLWSVQNM